MRSEFFDRPIDSVLSEYEQFCSDYLGPNSIGVKHIDDLWHLQHVPLRISALPEGTLCPLKVPQMVLENTHPDFAWLPNYFETLLSNTIWLPCTSATSAYFFRKMMNQFAQMTGGPLEFVPWQGHDFSMRGMAGVEASILSGMGHLLSFTGTDTIPAIRAAERFYHGANRLIGGSVAATEHSVMSCGGKESELDTFSRLLDLYPSGIVSIVSDTWDLWQVITKILPQLKTKIMSRDGKTVIRPDSGDPVKIICGDPDAPIDSPAFKGVIELLWDVFGGTLNEKGYKQLDSHIGAIYGDAITRERGSEILNRLEKKGFASTNIVFGVGSYTYQYVTRDTYGFAMKATWAEVNGQGRDLFKKPVTDAGDKISATGRLAVFPSDAGLHVVQRANPSEEAASLLQPVWENGKFLRRPQSFADVRKTLWEQA